VLQDDARTPQASIGKRVDLSAAAVNERIRRLVDHGIIQGFTVEIDDAKVGIDITAFIDVFIESPRHEAAFVALMNELPEVQECHFVTGDFTCLIKVKVTDRRALRDLVLDKINELEGVRQTRTWIVLATPKETPRIPIPEPGSDQRRKS
jgi:Lrp/AsnC family leucine-responsive transcriptional regulator